MVTLIRPGLADGNSGQKIDVGCFHGQTESYTTRWITVQTPKGTFTVWAGLVPNLPMPHLIGRDCAIFAKLLGAELQHPNADNRGPDHAGCVVGPPIWLPSRRHPGL